jgi:hypothetical protein
MIIKSAQLIVTKGIYMRSGLELRSSGDNCLKEQQAKTELSPINRELTRLKAQIAALSGTIVRA